MGLICGVLLIVVLYTYSPLLMKCESARWAVTQWLPPTHTRRRSHPAEITSLRPAVAATPPHCASARRVLRRAQFLS